MRFGPGFVAAAVFAATTPAHAQPTAPIKVDLTYDGVLNALHLPGTAKVLTLHVTERASAADFSTDAEMQSYGILRVFKRIDIQTAARGPVQAGLPRPQFFKYASADKDRVRRVSMTWNQDAVVVTPSQGDVGDPPPTRTQKLEAADPVTLFSRTVYAPSGQALCSRNWRSYDGRELYELQFQSGEPTSVSDEDRAMGFTSAVRCSVHYAEIAGFKHKRGESHDEGLKSAIHAEFGQLGATGPWVFLSMKADTILGYAEVELKTVHLSRP
jgi:hypothetical protein